MDRPTTRLQGLLKAARNPENIDKDKEKKLNKNLKTYFTFVYWKNRKNASFLILTLYEINL